MAIVTGGGAANIQMLSAFAVEFSSDNSSVNAATTFYDYITAPGPSDTFSYEVRLIGTGFAYGDGVTQPPTAGNLSGLEIDADGLGNAELTVQLAATVPVASIDFGNGRAVWPALISGDDTFNLGAMNSSAQSQIFGDHFETPAGATFAGSDIFTAGDASVFLIGDAYVAFNADAVYVGGHDAFLSTASDSAQDFIGDVAVVAGGAVVLGGNDYIDAKGSQFFRLVTGDVESASAGFVVDGGDDVITARRAFGDVSAAFGSAGTPGARGLIRGGSDTITGTDLSSHLVGDVGTIGIAAAEGDEVLGGNDFIRAGTGAADIIGDFDRILTDVVRTIGGDDFLHGGAGDDDIFGDHGAANLEATAGGHDRLYGNGGDDELFGQGGSDWIDGGSGNDVIDGGHGFGGSAGSDTVAYHSSFSGVTVNLALATAQDTGGGGVDTISNVENLEGSFFDDTLFGNGGSNTITGYSGRDVIGGGAFDALVGGAGNAVYKVNSASAPIVELAGQGDDGIYSSVNFTLPGFVESLILQEPALNGTGNDLANFIFGNGLANVIDGRGGADLMRGFSGNDIYAVDDSLDFVAEDAGGGEDTVYASADYHLQSNVETLIITGAATVGRGSAGNNRIFGSESLNVIDGRGGADYLRGFGGEDIFVFQRGEANGDVIADFTGNGAASGDRIAFGGYSQATAVITQLSATSWRISDGVSTEQFILANGYVLDSADYYFA